MRSRITKKRQKKNNSPLHYLTTIDSLKITILSVILVVSAGFFFFDKISSISARIVGGRVCSSNNNCSFDQYCNQSSHVCMLLSCSERKLALAPTASHRICYANYYFSNHSCVYTKYCINGSPTWCQKGTRGAQCDNTHSCGFWRSCSLNCLCQ